MAQGETVAVREGIWIDRQRLAEAGLGDEVTITVRPGEIRIVTPTTQPSDRPKGGWEIFRSLGQEAQPGELADPSTHHDRYLYGPTQ